MIHLYLQSNFDVNLLSELLKQGPVITGLVFAIIYFYKRQQKLEEKLEEANKKTENYLKDDRDILIKVIENNTKTMQELEQYLGKNHTK